ncbi:MAG: PucR family transcriptional regulator ligand-binding domain-containing protein [Eubacteriales bacterium]
MELTVKDILKMDSLREARIVAGDWKIDNIVKGITIIEAPDIVEWLSGGEVLLTSLYSVHTENQSYWQEYIKKMTDKGVSALIVKIGRVVEKIPEEIIESANQFGLPVLEIRKETKYIDIMYPVMSELFNKQLSKLQYYKKVQERFTELVIAGEGLEGVAKVLEDLIGNPVIIYDKNYFVLSSTNDKLNKFIEIEDSSKREKLNEKFYYFRQQVLFPDCDDVKLSQIIVPIQQINQIKAYLAVVEKNRLLSESEYMILENAATVISLEMVKRFAIGEVEKKFKYDLLDSLVSGNFQEKILLERASLIGWNIIGTYCVVLMEFENMNDYLSDQSRRSNAVSELINIVSNVARDYAKHYVRIRSDSLYILWSVSGKKEEVIQDIKKANLKIQVKLKNKFKNIKVLTGVGGIATDINEISRSYREAQDAINFAKILKEQFVSFSEMGIMRLLCNFAENSSLEEYVPASITKLQKYDEDYDCSLLNTLEVFLECNGNASQTAKKMFVHYKTVLHRLERVKEVGELDINNKQDRLEVELGLRIITILGKKKMGPNRA